MTPETPAAETPEAPPKRTVRRIASFGELASISMVDRRQDIEFLIGEEILQISIRPLSHGEMQTALSHGDVMPPTKPSQVIGAPPEYDLQNPAYKEALRIATQRRDACLIDYATELEIPGATLDEKAQSIAGQLGAGVVEMLIKQISELSEAPISTLGNFFSKKGSESSPS